MWTSTLLVMLLSTPAAERQTCDSLDFTEGEGLSLLAATVRKDAGRRVFFFSDDGSCPEGPAAKCRTKSYLVPDDDVVVAKRRGGFACVWYQRSAEEEYFIGWLPEAALEEDVPPPAPP